MNIKREEGEEKRGEGAHVISEDAAVPFEAAETHRALEHKLDAIDLMGPEFSEKIE